MTRSFPPATHRVLAAGWLTALLGACGGGGGDPPAAAPAPLPVPPPVLPLPGVTAAPIPPGPRSVAGVFALPGQAAEADPGDGDRDGDGLPDRVDPFPDRAAVIDSPLRRLALLEVYSEGAGWRATDKAHAELPLLIRFEGLSAQEPLFAVLWSPEGPRVAPLAVEGNAARLPAPALAAPITGISLATEQWQTPVRALQWQGAGLPMLADLGPANVGGTLTLEGLHLERIRHLRLGAEALPLHAAASGERRAELPAGARSGRIRVFDAEGEVDQAPVTLRRTVRIEVHPDLRAAIPKLLWQEEGRLHERSSAVSFQRSVEASAGIIRVLFEPLPGSFLPLQLLVGPEDATIQIDAARLLEGLAANGWFRGQPGAARSGQAGLEALRSVLRGASGQALAQRLQSAYGGGNVNAFIPQLFELAELAATAAPPAALDTQAKVGLRVRDLPAGQIGVRYGNVVDPLRNELSNFRVVNTDPTLGFIDRCEGILAAGPPAGFRPFDLCLENDNVVSASFAVTREGETRRARSHIDPRAGIFNSNISGGNTFGLIFASQATFMEADDKTPLCGLTPCRIDVLTGGLGVGLNERLNASDQAVADVLRRRALLDLVVLPLISKGLGLVGEDSARKCLATGTDKALASSIILTDFVSKIRDTSPLNATAVENLAKDFLRQPMIDLLLNLEGVIAGCGFQALGSATLVKRAIEQALERAFGSAENFGALLAGVLEGIRVGITLVEFATTPRQITFDYQPLTRVTSMTPEFDVSRPDPGAFIIRGTQLAETDPTAPSRFRPLLVLTGPGRTSGGPREITIEVQPGWVEVDAPLGQELTNRRLIRVPGPIFAERLRQNFRLGDIRVSLRYARNSPDSPDLAQLPTDLSIAAGSFRYLSAPEARNLAPAVVPQGDRVRISGYRLDTLAGPLRGGQVVVTLIPEGGSADAPTVVITRDLRLVAGTGSDPDQRTQLEFLAPNLDGINVQRFRVELESPQINADLGPVVVTASRALGSISVADFGNCQDDSARIELFNDSISGIEFFIDELVTERSSAFAGTLVWNNDAVDGGPVTAVRVTCESAGDDCINSRAGRQDPPGICTLAVVVTRPGRPAQSTVKLNLAEGESRRFDVGP